MTRGGFTAAIGPAALAALALGGCGGGTTARTVQVAAPQSARVAGIVRPCGETNKICYGINTVSVSVLDAHGRVASTMALTKSDRFSFSLTPGRYTVVLNVNGGDLAQAAITAEPHQTIYTDLTNPHIQ